MLAKQALIDFFHEHGMHHIFQLPGIHTLPLDDALIKSKIEVFRGRHESNCAFMADGFARVTGTPGVVIVTAGPGLGNIVSACMEAYGSDVPLFCLHVDVERKDAGKGILHEVIEPEAIFKHITKGTFRINNTPEFTGVLEEAYTLATAGRPGPVLVSFEYTLFEKNIPSPGSKPQFFDKESIEKQKFLSLMDAALHGKERPVIIGGKHLMVEKAEPILEEICLESSVPFFTTTGGKGVVPENSPYAFGNIMQKGLTKSIISSADVVIAIGTRLRDVDARRRGVKIQELIHIDIDDTWIGKNYPARLSSTGNIYNSLKGLRGIFKGKRFQWDLPGLKEQMRSEQVDYRKHHPGYAVISALREAIPPETVTVWDLNLLAYWAEYYFPVYRQNSFIMPRGISSIFYALPAAIGVKAGRPELPCLAICGDGGFLPGASELATIVKYNIPLVMLLYNNSSYGILQNYMESAYQSGREMSLENPDFVELVKSFGIDAKKVDSIDNLKEFFLRESWNKPILIEFASPVFSPPWSA